MTSLIILFGRWLYNQPYLLLSLTSLFWAGNLIVGRAIAGHVPPIAISYMRWVGAFLLLLTISWPQLRRDWPAIRGHMPVMTLLAITGVTLPNAIGFWGLQYTEAINALLLQSTGPLLIALWVFILFRDRLSPTQAVGITASLTGAVVIICRGDWDILRSIQFNIGDVLVVLALLIFGVYSAMTTRRPAVHPLSFLTFNIGYGALWLTPAFLWEMSIGHTMKIDPMSIGALLYSVIFPSLLAYLFFNRGVELIGPNRAAPFLHLVPVFGSLMAVFLLGERLQLYHVAGYALVACGIFIATRRYRIA